METTKIERGRVGMKEILRKENRYKSRRKQMKDKMGGEEKRRKENGKEKQR